MTPPNPSEEAREAADKISANDELVRGGWMPIGKFKAAEIIQSALDSALAASAARVKELETLMHRMIDASDKASDENPDEVREEARETLSIKVGETKP